MKLAPSSCDVRKSKNVGVSASKAGRSPRTYQPQRLSPGQDASDPGSPRSSTRRRPGDLRGRVRATEPHAPQGKAWRPQTRPRRSRATCNRYDGVMLCVTKTASVQVKRHGDTRG